MKRILVYVVLVMSVLSNEWWVNDIPSITADNVAEMLGKKKLVIAKFFTPWCYFCEKMNEEYLKLHEHYKDHSGVLIAKINCQDDDSLCQYFNVHGYPQIWSFKPGSVSKGDRYTQVREFEPMKQWIDARSQKTQEQIQASKQHEQQQQDRKGHCVGIFENIFGLFEQMENQNMHLDDKLNVLEQEVNQVQNEDQKLVNRISFEKKQFHWGQALLIFLLGGLVAITSFYMAVKIKNMLRPQQILP